MTTEYLVRVKEMVTTRKGYHAELVFQIVVTVGPFFSKTNSRFSQCRKSKASLSEAEFLDIQIASPANLDAQCAKAVALFVFGLAKTKAANEAFVKGRRKPHQGLLRITSNYLIGERGKLQKFSQVFIKENVTLIEEIRGLPLVCLDNVMYGRRTMGSKIMEDLVLNLAATEKAKQPHRPIHEEPDDVDDNGNLIKGKIIEDCSHLCGMQGGHSLRPRSGQADSDAIEKNLQKSMMAKTPRTTKCPWHYNRISMLIT